MSSTTEKPIEKPIEKSTETTEETTKKSTEESTEDSAKKSTKQSTKQPNEQSTEQQNPEEETHKVFIGNLSFTSTEESIKDFFSDAGEVIDTAIVKKGSRPKGFGFVAFKTLGEAEKAVKELDKKELDGREISVQIANQREPHKPNEKKKKRKNKKSRQSTEITADNEKPKTSVFVANLPLDITMMDLSDLFKDYQVESALVAIQRSGRSKGYGFVELKTVDEMNKVLREFVNIEVQGRPIHVSAATSEKTSERKLNPANKDAEEEEHVVTPTPAPKKKTRKRKPKRAANKESTKEDKEEQKEDVQEAVKETQNANDTKEDVTKSTNASKKGAKKNASKKNEDSSVKATTDETTK